MGQTEQVLIESKVRPTANRIAVLEIFLQQHRSLSHARLQCLLNHQIDRVSLYRTLLDLVNAGLLTRLVNSEGVAQFHYRKPKSRGEGILTPHFKCNHCDAITALPALPSTYIKRVSSIGHIQDARLLLEGICLECANAL
ncbi:Fur family transcriptional regulator [Dyadobacter crusticola]|uniref:Fur family transcriptional regulator n=1 Tax=Dyadobacter crusticola TaxID=292407 RepID=UPI00068AE273|nr:transcriptional repressor [Dyadobacter crusticola]